MKYIELTTEVDKALVQIVDAALKTGGFSLVPHVNLVLNAVKTKDEEIKEEK